MALALPWPAFSYLYCDPASPACAAHPVVARGAGSLFGTAGGLSVIGATPTEPVATGVVWFVMLLLILGAVLSLRNRLGAVPLLLAVGIYAFAIHPALAARGAAHTPAIEFGFGIGFWLAVLAAVASLSPLAFLQRGGRDALPRARAAAEREAGPAAAAPGAAPLPAGAEGPLLSVRGLTVRFFTYDGVLRALDGVDFELRHREILGLVGETGCGKSVTAKAIMRLIPDPPGRITAGAVLFDGINLLDSIEEEAQIRVNRRGRARIRRNRRIAERVEAVMRLLRGNDISMIFQEPTAALNPVVSVGEQVGETILTHQMGDIVQQIQRTREVRGLEGRFHALLLRREERDSKVHDIFRRLSAANAALHEAAAKGDGAAAPALRDEVDAGDAQIRRITGVYRTRSTTPVLRFFLNTGGRLVFGTKHFFTSVDTRISLLRRVPFLGKARLMGPIEEEARRRVVEMFKQVNIPDPEGKASAFAFELSGGMQQRVMIAMALSCRPRLLIADEPTTALDVTIQAQVLSLIRNLRDQFGSSVILITHDLGVVAETCERVGVMYAGVMAEVGEVAALFNRPRHPYTVGLMRSIPETLVRTGKLSIIPGNVPSLLNPPSGCRFHPRCPFASALCSEKVPELREVSPGHAVACHLYDHPEAFPPERVRQRDAGLDRAWEEAVAT